MVWCVTESSPTHSCRITTHTYSRQNFLYNDSWCSEYFETFRKDCLHFQRRNVRRFTPDNKVPSNIVRSRRLHHLAQSQYIISSQSKRSIDTPEICYMLLFVKFVQLISGDSGHEPLHRLFRWPMDAERVTPNR
jgi:hypothetical protein